MEDARMDDRQRAEAITRGPMFQDAEAYDQRSVLMARLFGGSEAFCGAIGIVLDRAGEPDTKDPDWLDGTAGLGALEQLLRRLQRSRADGLAYIALERARQISEERFDAEHDDAHGHGELGSAAACYAMPSGLRDMVDSREGSPAPPAGRLEVPRWWPFEAEWWKPAPADLEDVLDLGTRLRELEKAGALIAAEIDRVLRMADRLERKVGSPTDPLPDVAGV